MFIIVSSGELLREIMLQGYDLGMNSGEYAFLTIEVMKSKDSSSDHSWHRIGDKRNKEAREMFESLLTISVRVPTSIEYTNFIHDVLRRAGSSSSSSITELDVSLSLYSTLFSLSVFYSFFFSLSLFILLFSLSSF